MDTGVKVSHPADAATAATLAAVQRFNDAFNRHDVAGIVRIEAAEHVLSVAFPGEAPLVKRCSGNRL